MDPNANLQELRELVQQANERGRLSRDDALRMAELFDALDGWICRGGFLPASWMQSRMNQESAKCK